MWAAPVIKYYLIAMYTYCQYVLYVYRILQSSQIAGGLHYFLWLQVFMLCSCQLQSDSGCLSCCGRLILSGYCCGAVGNYCVCENTTAAGSFGHGANMQASTHCQLYGSTACSATAASESLLHARLACCATEMMSSSTAVITQAQLV